ncbi:hypothetical protein E2562_016741 [Oryza meyeriana var. granulata]|uniref:Uncharacterized protein n=1 Tax=Oryza meyeriana var. granulata TaxID=110450 RepID=A0A6G1BXS0_9ORYZ|nr:hypothetical protein E2562_016741 [Oryza meyeriana var. granulata]
MVTRGLAAPIPAVPIPEMWCRRAGEAVAGGGSSVLGRGGAGRRQQRFGEGFAAERYIWEADSSAGSKKLEAD